MHVIREPNDTYTTIFLGRPVYTGTREQAWKIGTELEEGERCPHCLARVDCSTEPHCEPDRRNPTNGQPKVEA